MVKILAGTGWGGGTVKDQGELRAPYVNSVLDRIPDLGLAVEHFPEKGLGKYAGP